MSEPTSALTFEDLILEVAYKLGIAYYGATGSDAPAVPTDAHDLTLSKRIVNKAIRMFIHDAPESGWRWTRPVASLTIWGSIATDADNTVTAGAFASSQTTLTAEADSFYPSMERKSIVISTVGTFTIKSYVSATQIVVEGDASAAAADTWSITADGNYTLPDTFGGQFTGDIAFEAGTNRGVYPRWVNESVIRRHRSNVDTDTGTPTIAAVRLMSSTATPRRRWELMVQPVPAEVLTLEFPYILAFDELVNLTDTPPCPVGHDEAIKAACMAQAEKDVEEVINGPEWTYYRDIALPASHRVDARSAPRRLGYCGNGVPSGSSIEQFREGVVRPTVTFNQ